MSTNTTLKTTRHGELIRPGCICMSRPSGGNCDYISITIDDDASRTEFCEVRVKYEDFTLALTGRMGTPMEFIHRPALVGMVREHKTEKVKNGMGRGDYDAITKALAPFEVDGWVGRRDDVTNPHKSNRDGTSTVIFERYIDPATGRHVEDWKARLREVADALIETQKREDQMKAALCWCANRLNKHDAGDMPVEVLTMLALARDGQKEVQP